MLLDLAVLHWFQSVRTYAGEVFFSSVTRLGEIEYLYLLIGIVFWCFSKRAGKLMGLCIGITHLMSNLLKAVFCKLRPFVRDPSLEPPPETKIQSTGYSFPSGHTSNAVATLGPLALYYKGRSKYNLLSWVFTALTALVCISRMYLVVHTPQDVLVALAYSVAVVLFAPKLLEWAEKSLKNMLITGGAMITFSVVVLLFTQLRAYPWYHMPENTLALYDGYEVGFCTAFLISWILEIYFIKFDTKSPIWFQVIKVVIGFTVAWYSMDLLKTVPQIGNGIINGFFIKFVPTFWVFALWPFVFSRVQKAFNIGSNIKQKLRRVWKLKTAVYFEIKRSEARKKAQ